MDRLAGFVVSYEIAGADPSSEPRRQDRVAPAAQLDDDTMLIAQRFLGQRGLRLGTLDRGIDPANGHELDSMTGDPQAPGRGLAGRCWWPLDESEHIDIAHFPAGGKIRSAAHNSADSRRYTRSTFASARMMSAFRTTPLLRRLSITSSSEASRSSMSRAIFARGGGPGRRRDGGKGGCLDVGGLTFETVL